MVKVMGNSDVLRCLAKHIIYTPPSQGGSKYQCDIHCDRRCVECGKNDLCLAFRKAIDEKG